MPPEQPLTIAIIGGGANGVATFVNLINQLLIYPAKKPLQFILFEKSDEMGPGLAYGTEQLNHLLNTPAGLMGIFIDEPMHFVEWLNANRATVQAHYPGIRIEADDFAYLPRHVYGLYLKTVFDEYAALARQADIGLEKVYEEVTDADIREDQTILTLSSGRTLAADVVVLATGTPKPNNYPQLKQYPQYIDFPWPARRILEAVPTDAPVAVLGSSLTAIDTLLTFTGHGYTGKITFYSPNGLLPRVQAPFNAPADRQILTLENIRKLMRSFRRPIRTTELFRLFRQEVERIEGGPIDWKATLRKDRPAHELLKEDMALAREGKSTLQNVAYATRHLSSPVWKMLTQDEKTKFKKRFGEYWDINRHGMPLINAEKLARAFESGQLEVKNGIQDVRFDEKTGQFQLTMADGTVDTAPYVVNATGTARDVRKMDIPLIQQLLRKKLISPYPLGGITVDTQTLRVISPGLTRTRMYATGQLVFGQLLDTNAVWFNVESIGLLCNDIRRQLAGELAG